METFSGDTEPWTGKNMHHLYCFIVWGFPAYVLDLVIRDSGNIHKWQQRSLQRKCVGLSPKHEITVINILNLRTGTMTPQFHVVYKKWSQTVYINEVNIIK